MFTLLLSIHCFLCIFLVVLVLMQQGKGADLGATLSGGSNTVFGAAGAADMLTKLTTGTAIAFMLTSVMLVRAYNSSGAIGTSTDIMEGSLFTESDEVQVKPEVTNFENLPTGEEEAKPESASEGAAVVSESTVSESAESSAAAADDAAGEAEGAAAMAEDSGDAVVAEAAPEQVESASEEMATGKADEEKLPEASASQ